MKKRKKKNARYLKLCQILGIAILCIALCVGSYNFTMAWFKDESVTSNEPNILVVGTVDLEVTTNFNFYNLTLAPDTLYTTYQDEDNNTISYATILKTAETNNVSNIYVRAKFETNRSELSLYFRDTLTTSTSYDYDNDHGKWCFNEKDGYYYYIGSVGGEDPVEFNQGYYVDNTLSNEVANELADIKFTFESIQRPYGAYTKVWPDAPDVFNEFALSDTGYPKAES